jgi:hypothetical protein
MRVPVNMLQMVDSVDVPVMKATMNADKQIIYAAVKGPWMGRDVTMLVDFTTRAYINVRNPTLSCWQTEVTHVVVTGKAKRVLEEMNVSPSKKKALDKLLAAGSMAIDHPAAADEAIEVGSDSDDDFDMSSMWK